MLQQSYAYQPALEYEVQPQNPKTSKKIVLTILLILPLLFLLTVLILFIIFLVRQSNINSTTEINSAVSVTRQLQIDLETKLIKTFVSANTATACASGLEELPLGQFPGIEKGCVCKSGNDYVKASDDQCTSSSTTCKSGTGISPKEYKTLFADKKLCVKYLDPSEYIWGTQQQCTAHATFQHYCKSGGICTANANNCPINGLSWSDILGTNSVEIQSSTNYLNWLKELANQPIIRLEAAYSANCLDKVAYPELDSKTSYPLLGLQYSGCDSYDNYKKHEDSAVMTITNVDYTYPVALTQNSISYDSNTAPFYSEYIAAHNTVDKWHIQLIFRPIVGYDGICQKNKGFDNLQNVNKVGTTLVKPLYIFTLVGLILSAIGLLVWIILFALSYSSTSPKKSKKTLSQFLKLTHIIAILVALFIIFIFIHYMSSVSGKYDGLESGQDGFNKAIATKCYVDTKGFKDAINVVLSFINFVVDTAYPFIITFFVLALIYLVLFSILSLICLMSGESPFLPPYVKTYKY